MRNRVIVLALVLGLSGAWACQTKPAPDSGFLTGAEKMQPDKQYPFQRVWVDPGFQPSDPRYKSIYVAPVNTDHVTAHPAWKGAKQKSPEKIAQDTEELAVFTRETFQEAFRNDPRKRLEVVTVPRGDSLRLELALVEVVPNDAVLGFLGISPYGTMGAGTVAKEVGKGSAAIEGRVRAPDGEIVAMFADRKTGKTAPVNVRRATFYGEARVSIREWASQCVAIVKAEPGQRVKDSKPITLKPW